jgi:hypothetical protein
MPDERDDEQAPDGPHRPLHPRRATYNTEGPGVGGNTVHEVRGLVRDATSSPQPLRPDARFRNAPLTDAERKQLSGARTKDEFCKMLGELQDERARNGQLPEAAPVYESLASPLLKLPTAEQKDRGIRPTAEQLAYIHGGATEAERKDRAAAFLEERNTQNDTLFRQSRHWDAALALQAQPPEGKRLNDHGVQGWNAHVDELRNIAYRRDRRQTSEPQGPSLDSRFEDAPLTPAEIKQLKVTKEPERANELLTRFHKERMDDGRAARPDPSENGLLFQAFDARELDRLGLTPTRRDLDLLRDGATGGQELERTKAFIRDRQAQNTRWYYDAQQNARAQESFERGQASSYWYARFERVHSDREARTEQAERRTDLQMKRDQAQQNREGDPRTNPGKEKDGREDGGRER